MHSCASIILFVDKILKLLICHMLFVHYHYHRRVINSSTVSFLAHPVLNYYNLHYIFIFQVNFG